MNTLATLGGLLVIIQLASCEQPSVDKPLQYSSAPSDAAVPVYRLAIHPLHNPQKLSETYQPLLDYLNSQLQGAQFELEASRDYQAYEQKYRDRKPTFLLANPWRTLQAMKAGYHVITMADDTKDFKGILIICKDSGIKLPSNLKGKE
jgi:phosphonate transport system substrate-binding protein